MILDAATRRNLELDQSLSGRAECTLAGVLDRTATAMGGRELRRWMQRPLLDAPTRARRYHAIETLIASSRTVDLHGLLHEVGAFSRAWRCVPPGRATWCNCARRWERFVPV